MDGLLDHIHLGHGVNGEKHILFGVVSENWSSFLVVALKTGLQGLGVVVGSLDEGLTSDVIFALDLGWIELDVVGSSRCLVNPSTLDSLNEDLVINFEFNDLVDLAAGLAEHLVELLSLYHSSRESIQKHALLAFWLVHGSLDKAQNDFVADKFTLSEDVLHLEAHGGAARNIVTDKVAGCSVANTKLVLDDGALGALTSSRWSDHDDVHVWNSHALGSSLDFGEQVVKLHVSQIHI